VKPGRCRFGEVGETEPARAGHGEVVSTRIPLHGCLLLLAATGCVHEQEVAVEGEDYEAPRTVETADAWQITVDDEQPPAPGPAPTTRTADERLLPDPVPFKIGAGYGALAHVDLAPCREHGLQPGYVHVRATFTSLGYIVRATVESAAPPPPPALDCIAGQLRQVGVPKFDAQSASLSKRYFVRAGEAGGMQEHGE
jgi:hypothetical protein